MMQGQQIPFPQNQFQGAPQIQGYPQQMNAQHYGMYMQSQNP